MRNGQEIVFVIP